MEEMLIEKVKADSAIDWSPHHHAYVNPYNGCTAGCPFCFWLSRQGWEGRIQIRENITELLENELREYDPKEFIYFSNRDSQRFRSRIHGIDYLGLTDGSIGEHIRFALHLSVIIQ